MQTESRATNLHASEAVVIVSFRCRGFFGYCPASQTYPEVFEGIPNLTLHQPEQLFI
jgi:hypothetical protein